MIVYVTTQIQWENPHIKQGVYVNRNNNYTRRDIPKIYSIKSGWVHYLHGCAIILMSCENIDK